MDLAQAIRMQSWEQHIKALKVPDEAGGTWQAVETSAAPVFLLTDAQYNALIQAGVVRSNRQEDNARGSKKAAKKTEP
jgi:hypothetical protein